MDTLHYYVKGVNSLKTRILLSLILTFQGLRLMVRSFHNDMMRRL